MNPDGTQDRCLHSFYETSNGQSVDWRDRVVGWAKPSGEPYQYDDALKFTSQLRDFTGRFGTVYAGAENVIDCNNRLRQVELSADRMVANGCKYPITIKGGCESVTLRGMLVGHGKECDVDAGNRSEQSDSWVKYWSLGLSMEDGSPVRVRCLLAMKPYFEPDTGPYEYVFPSPDAWYHGIAIWLLQLWWRIRY